MVALDVGALAVRRRAGLHLSAFAVARALAFCVVSHFHCFLIVTRILDSPSCAAVVSIAGDVRMRADFFDLFFFSYALSSR